MIYIKMISLFPMSFFKRIFSGNSNSNGTGAVNLAEGDIFHAYTDGKYLVYKLLSDDFTNDRYHVLSYYPLSHIPTIADISALKVNIYHAPFNKGAFKNAAFLAHTAVLAQDLIGYHEYLRQTQTPEHYFPIAQEYYLSALQLTDDYKFREAIDVYSKAIDLAPQFFEAIDNRAFCKMDMALWQDAIDDFRLSLQANPDTMLAEFSIGECYFQMKDYTNARHHFQIAHNIAPEDPTPILFLKKVADITGAAGE